MVPKCFFCPEVEFPTTNARAGLDLAEIRGKETKVKRMKLLIAIAIIMLFVMPFVVMADTTQQRAGPDGSSVNITVSQNANEITEVKIEVVGIGVAIATTWPSGMTANGTTETSVPINIRIVSTDTTGTIVIEAPLNAAVKTEDQDVMSIIAEATAEMIAVGPASEARDLWTAQMLTAFQSSDPLKFPTISAVDHQRRNIFVETSGGPLHLKFPLSSRSAEARQVEFLRTAVGHQRV